MNPIATDSPDGAQVGAKTQVLAVGDWQGREFVAATSGLSVARDWSHASSINEACDLLRNCQQPPELIFLAQPLPGIYCQGDIDRLQQVVPLTRLVVVVGSWCEGELRTGSPPSGVIRLYWYEFSSWWQAAIRRRDADLCPPWSLPLDHVQAGRWSPVNDVAPLKAPSKNTALLSVTIDAADFTVYETLSAALSNFGILSHWQGRDENATPAASTAPATTPTTTAGIWDGGQLGARELKHLTKFCRQTNGPVIALLDFPRLEHFKQARAAGAAAVFAKPYIVKELVAALEQNAPSKKSKRAADGRRYQP